MEHGVDFSAVEFDATAWGMVVGAFQIEALTSQEFSAWPSRDGVHEYYLSSADEHRGSDESWKWVLRRVTKTPNADLRYYVKEFYLEVDPEQDDVGIKVFLANSTALSEPELAELFSTPEKTYITTPSEEPHSKNINDLAQAYFDLGRWHSLQQPELAEVLYSKLRLYNG